MIEEFGNIEEVATRRTLYEKLRSQSKRLKIKATFFLLT